MYRRSRRTTWVERVGAKPLPLVSLACAAEQKARKRSNFIEFYKNLRKLYPSLRQRLSELVKQPVPPWTGAPQCMDRRSRGTTWAERVGAKPFRWSLWLAPLNKYGDRTNTVTNRKYPKNLSPKTFFELRSGADHLPFLASLILAVSPRPPPRRCEDAQY